MVFEQFLSPDFESSPVVSDDIEDNLDWVVGYASQVLTRVDSSGAESVIRTAPQSLARLATPELVENVELAVTELVKANAPAVASFVRVNAPLAEQFVRDSAPAVASFVKENAPLAEQFVRDNAPMVSKFLNDNAPAVEEYVRKNAPAVVDFARENAPAVASFVRVNAALAEQFVRDNAPMVSKFLNDNAPAVEEYVRKNAPAVVSFARENAPAVASFEKGNPPVVVGFAKESVPAVARFAKENAPAVEQRMTASGRVPSDTYVFSGSAAKIEASFPLSFRVADLNQKFALVYAPPLRLPEFTPAARTNQLASRVESALEAVYVPRIERAISPGVGKVVSLPELKPDFVRQSVMEVSLASRMDLKSLYGSSSLQPLFSKKPDAIQRFNSVEEIRGQAAVARKLEIVSSLQVRTDERVRVFSALSQSESGKATAKVPPFESLSGFAKPATKPSVPEEAVLKTREVFVDAPIARAVTPNNWASLKLPIYSAETLSFKMPQGTKESSFAGMVRREPVDGTIGARMEPGRPADAVKVAESLKPMEGVKLVNAGRLADSGKPDVVKTADCSKSIEVSGLRIPIVRTFVRGDCTPIVGQSPDGSHDLTGTLRIRTADKIYGKGDDFVSPPKLRRRLAKLRGEKRYLTGIEIALAGACIAASVAKVHNSVTPDEASVAAPSPQAVLHRAKHIVAAQDTLARIAEEKFGDGRYAWLLLELNSGAVQQNWSDKQLIVRLKERQEIELPVAQDLEGFRQRLHQFENQTLVTVVESSSFSRELLALHLGAVIGV
ncbi:MAG: hypothetical protein K2Y39_07875 [Candidatus Obscuribacterales bacterium]|nr:hypothetical protein [Candidatus Obscuribacterales bacterium]